MVGHEEIFGELKQLARRGGLGHGYIFFGPPMVGKKLAARLIAEYLEWGADGDRGAADGGRGETGRGARGGEGGERHGALSDFMLIEPGEGGSIGIDAAREMKNFLWQKPNVSSRRTLVVDGAEFMTPEAQNALLKAAEEPPASSLLILVAGDAESILPTIASRLPKIYFGPVAEKELERWLKENGMPVGAAKKAHGLPGLAWRISHDADFRKQLELAEKLLSAPPAPGRRDLVKKIIEPDDFNFRKFLDAVIMNLAWQTAGERADGGRAATWHKALLLRARESDFSLNPRLQLEALLSARDA